jgi:riboflavin kinase/FMN adenylyltransferase
MLIYDDIEDLKNVNIPGSVVTIGNFDGVHLGHKELIKKVKQRAEELTLPSIIITFDPHPLKVIGGKCPPVITPTKQKLELLEKEGVDIVVCLKFDKKMAELSGLKFVEIYLINLVKMKEIVIGYDYRFGKNREGNFELLKELGNKYNFKVWKVDPVFFDGEIVSSTRIRNLVQQGKVLEVRPLLGRFYQVFGQVVEGHKRGSKLLGIPTANLNLIDELVPKIGVYAVFAEIDKKKYPAVANVGYNPTFENKVLSVEVHIFDFNKNIYDKELRVHFIQRIRSEKKFSSILKLKEQILKDIETAKKILASLTN